MGAKRPPLYQPSDTKLLRITLTSEQWWKLCERMVADTTLEQFVNEIISKEADRDAR